MAKPRIFISSTFYDLKYLRGALDQFIHQMGYEPVLFEKGAIAFAHDRSIEDSCVQEVGLCDILILIVGGRYGSLSQQDQENAKKHATEAGTVEKIRSITRKEYEQARARDVPIFIFVEAGVLGEFRTFQKNRDTKGIQYAHVDDRRVFELIEDIMGERRNNFVREFNSADDIISWLRDQWGGIFAEMLRQKVAVGRMKEMEVQISELSQVVKSLKAYSEVIMRNVASGSADEVIKEQSEKRKTELIERMVERYFLPSFLKQALDLDSSPKEILEMIIVSAGFPDLIHSLVSETKAKKFLEEWPLAEGGPWGDFQAIKKEYESSLKSLN